MLKNKIMFLDLVIYSVITVIYVIPISSLNLINHYDIYGSLRLILCVYAIIIILWHKKVKKYYLIYVIIFFLKLFIYNEFSMNIIFLVCSFICFDYIFEHEINFIKVDYFIRIASDIFMIQIILCTIIYQKQTIFCLIYDPNYIGYFIFLLSVYFYYTDKKSRFYIWSILGLFTFSRNYFIAIILFFSINFLKNKFSFLKKIGVKIVSFGYICLQCSIVPLSYLYIYIFNNNEYEYVLRTGFQRLTNLMDSSNYLRFKINTLAFETMKNFDVFLLGEKEGDFIGLHLLEGKTIYPHNTFFAITVKFGTIIGLDYIYKFVKMLYKYFRLYSFWFSFFVYQLFLGPSTFYGTELILILIIIKNINKYINREC